MTSWLQNMTLHQLQNIANNFQINSKIITYQAIHIGHINQTYRITCSNEDYILQNIKNLHVTSNRIAEVLYSILLQTFSILCFHLVAQQPTKGN